MQYGELARRMNEVQRKAVECTDGPVMIVAGAGSGKTRVLTYTVAHLVKQRHGSLWSIYWLSLSPIKSAREMKERRIAKDCSRI